MKSDRSLVHGLAALAALVLVSFPCRAEIELSDQTVPATLPSDYRPATRFSYSPDDETEPLVSPLRLGGIMVPVSGGRIAFPFFWFPNQPAPVAVQAPMVDNTSRAGARRSLMRAHAFSQNAYRPLRKDEINSWHSNYYLISPW